MTEQSEPLRRKEKFREAIATFIDERCAAKLKGLSDAAAIEMAAKYDYHTWLADAARRVTQIQAVTHVLKATHPDARGSSLFIEAADLAPRPEIGTHSLGNAFETDIVGNAAALDVYKFLKQEVEARRLLDWLQDDDADMLAALHDDPATAQQWAEAFKSLTRSTDALASHRLAKQVYWSIDDDPGDDSGFHLLQPLFSSSLAHAVHQDINAARFGEPNKLARQARREGKPLDSVYLDYRGLVVRKLGGTKPQNISQLNSERGGANYLLASLPPQWDQNRPKEFLRIESALSLFNRFDGVSEQVGALLELLKSKPDPTMETRIKREVIERCLGHSLAAFGLATQQLFQPGWTRVAECKLPLCEQIWLDPERVDLPCREEHLESDQAFKQAFEWKDWPDEVAHRFGNWLNAILQRHGLPVGDAEHRHWAKQALIDAEWPTPMQRRAMPTSEQQEVPRG